jgi:uncharacterized membrane protein YkoI
MFKKGVMALFIIVAISAIIVGAFAITNNKNSSNGITSNQLTPLNTPLNNTSAAKSNVAPANTNNPMPTAVNPLNKGKTANTNGKINAADTVNTANGAVSHNANGNNNIPASESVGSTSKHVTTYHLSSVTLISPAKAQEIAAQYIEQAGATPGTPDLISQDGKKVYVVPVMLNNINVGEIDIDAQDGSNLGGAGGVKT